MAKVYMTEEEMKLCEEHFGKVYFSGDGKGDYHGEFAKLLGVSRERAKEMAWEFIWRSNSQGAKWLRRDTAKIGHLVRQVEISRKACSIPVTRYAIYEEAEAYAKNKEKNKRWVGVH